MSVTLLLSYVRFGLDGTLGLDGVIINKHRIEKKCDNVVLQILELSIVSTSKARTIKVFFEKKISF